MEPSLQTETLRLEQLTSSPMLGIFYLDEQGHLVQYFDSDPALKEAVIEYQRERIAQRARFERNPPSYSVRED